MARAATGHGSASARDIFSFHSLFVPGTLRLSRLGHGLLEWLLKLLRYVVLSAFVGVYRYYAGIATSDGERVRCDHGAAAAAFRTARGH